MTEEPLKRWLNKDVRVIMEIGNATIYIDGKITEISNDWITINTKSGIKTLNKNSVVYIESKRKNTE